MDKLKINFIRLIKYFLLQDLEVFFLNVSINKFLNVIIAYVDGINDPNHASET